MEGAKAASNSPRFSSTQWGILLNRNLWSSLQSLGTDLQIHRNIRQKIKSVKNIQGFCLHYGVTSPASLFQSCSQRRSPSHHAWYKHIPNTGSVPLPGAALHTRFCAQSRQSRPRKLQEQSGKQKPQTARAVVGRAPMCPRAKLPNAPAGAAIRRGGTAPHASTNVAVNTLKSSEQFPSHSVGRTEAGHTASPWPNFPCSNASLFYLWTRNQIQFLP